MVTENSVGSENTEVPIIRDVMLAARMSSLLVAIFALVGSRFRTRAALKVESLALRHQLAVFQKKLAASLAPQPLRLTVVGVVNAIVVELGPRPCESFNATRSSFGSFHPKFRGCCNINAPRKRFLVHGVRRT